MPPGEDSESPPDSDDEALVAAAEGASEETEGEAEEVAPGVQVVTSASGQRVVTAQDHASLLRYLVRMVGPAQARRMAAQLNPLWSGDEGDEEEDFPPLPKRPRPLAHAELRGELGRRLASLPAALRPLAGPPAAPLAPGETPGGGSPGAAAGGAGGPSGEAGGPAARTRSRLSHRGDGAPPPAAAPGERGGQGGEGAPDVPPDAPPDAAAPPVSLTVPRVLRLRETGLMSCSASGRGTKGADIRVAPGAVPVPAAVSRVVDEHPSRGYCGRFSPDGTLFVAAFQGRCVRVYDVERRWRLEKDVEARMLQWTITDCTLSQDGEFLIYASIAPVAHLVRSRAPDGVVSSISNITEVHEGLDFDPEEGGLAAERRGRELRGRSFGIWSCKWAPGGQEVAVGTSEPAVRWMDMDRRVPVAASALHEDDVNAVSFVGPDPNVLVSGSDDTLLRVFDRRTVDGSGRRGPVAVLPGHTDGVTSIDGRGDGRYFVSNAKDQTCRLWDLRAAVPAARAAGLTWRHQPLDWDYRWEAYPAPGREVRHPEDRSIMTYRGHAVCSTLIRSYFSPAGSTGGRFVYSGSACGTVFVWDAMTGEVASRLAWHEEVVRDVAWSPTMPTIATVGFDGAVALWEGGSAGGDDGWAVGGVTSIRGDKYDTWF